MIDKVSDYQYLVGTLHRDSDDFELYKTVSVVVKTSDEVGGPIIVAYRRRVSEKSKLMPMTEENEYPYQIQDTVQDTADYASDHPAQVSKQAA